MTTIKMYSDSQLKEYADAAWSPGGTLCPDLPPPAITIELTSDEEIDVNPNICKCIDDLADKYFQEEAMHIDFVLAIEAAIKWMRDEILKQINTKK